MLNLPLNQPLFTCFQAGDGGEGGSVLVTGWEVEQQILYLTDLQSLQPLGELGTNPLQCSDRCHVTAEMLPLELHHPIHLDSGILG